MDVLLKEHLNRTRILMESLEVVKICDDDLAAKLILDIRRSMNKSQILLENLERVHESKKNISDEMDKLSDTLDNLSRWNDEIYELNKEYFDNQSFNTQTSPNNESQNGYNEETSRDSEASPIPSTWVNGYLDTPKYHPQANGRGLEQPSSADAHIPVITQLHPSEMQNVPTYMKGRLTCENINSFVNTLNSVLKQKYSISLLKRKDVKRKDLVQYCEWKSQEQEFAMGGKPFFTTDDLLNLGNHKLDKITDKIFQILRHSNRLRQTRVNGKVVVYSLI